MARKKTQEAILRSEFFWFGGVLGPPKAYDAGTSHNSPPNLRVSEDRAADQPAEPTNEDNGAGRSISIRDTVDGWSVTFDELE